MDYGTMIGDSFAYAKDAVIGKWMQWILLLVATLILAIPLLGYLVKVLRGEKPAPEVTGWGTLFIDGIKLLIISLIWAIPCLILFFFFFGSMIGGLLMDGNPSAMVAAFTGAIVYLLLFLVVAIITGLLSIIGAVRFARTGSIGEAFNFGAILDTIGKIGWGSYIIALIVLIIVQIVIGIVLSIIAMIPVLGGIIQFVLFAPISIFEYRYICQIYDAAGV